MSNSQAVANRPTNNGAVAPLSGVEAVLIGGDLSKLTADERLEYYVSLCQSLGLNHLTRPFQYVTLSGKLTLYATKDCSEQLRKKNGVSITGLRGELLPGDLYRVEATATDATGKIDMATGVLTIKGLSGETLANAMMKAETKAKRRVTLSICGLGMLDETETDFDDAPPAPRPANQAPPKRNRGSQPPPIHQPHEKPFGHEDDVIDGESRPVDTETGEIPFTWTANDLNDVLKKRAIALADLSGVLGAECNKETFPDLIDGWLKVNPGATLETLAAAAIEYAMTGPSPEQAGLGV